MTLLPSVLLTLGAGLTLLASTIPANALGGVWEPKFAPPLGFNIFGSEYAFVSNKLSDLATGAPTPTSQISRRLLATTTPLWWT